MSYWVRSIKIHPKYYFLDFSKKLRANLSHLYPRNYNIVELVHNIHPREKVAVMYSSTGGRLER